MKKKSLKLKKKFKKPKILASTKKKIKNKYKKTFRKPKILASTKKKYVSKNKHNKSKKKKYGGFVGIASKIVKKVLPAAAVAMSNFLKPDPEKPQNNDFPKIYVHPGVPQYKPKYNPQKNLPPYKSNIDYLKPYSTLMPPKDYSGLIPPINSNFFISSLHHKVSIPQNPPDIKLFKLIKDGSSKLFHIDKPDENQIEIIKKLMQVSIPLLNDKNIIKYAWTIPYDIEKNLDIHDEETKLKFEKLFKARDDYYRKINEEYTPNFNFSNSNDKLPNVLKDVIVKKIQRNIVEKNRKTGETRKKLFNIETINLIDKINTEIQKLLEFSIFQNNIHISIDSYQGIPDYFIYTILENMANKKDELTLQHIENNEFIEEAFINTKQFGEYIYSSNVSYLVDTIEPLQQKIVKPPGNKILYFVFSSTIVVDLLGNLIYSLAKETVPYFFDTVVMNPLKYVVGSKINHYKDYGTCFEICGLITTNVMMWCGLKKWEDITTQTEFTHHLINTIDHPLELILKDITDKGSAYFIPLIVGEVISPLAIQSINGWIPGSLENKDKFFIMNFQFIDTILPGFLNCLRNEENITLFLNKPEVKQYVNDYIDNGTEFVIDTIVNGIRSGINSQLHKLHKFTDDPDFDSQSTFLDSDELQYQNLLEGYKNLLEGTLTYLTTSEMKTAITEKIKTKTYEILNVKLEDVNNYSQIIDLDILDSMHPVVEEEKQKLEDSKEKGKQKLQDFKDKLHNNYLANKHLDPNTKIPISEFIQYWGPSVWSLINNIATIRSIDGTVLQGVALLKSIKIDLYSIAETIALIAEDDDIIQLIENQENKNIIIHAGEGILSKNEILHVLLLLTSNIFVKKYKKQIIDVNKKINKIFTNFGDKELQDIIYTKLYLLE